MFIVVSSCLSLIVVIMGVADLVYVVGGGLVVCSC